MLVRKLCLEHWKSTPRRPKRVGSTPRPRVQEAIRSTPTAIFVFVHGGLREFSVLDAGIFVQTLMLSAHAHGLGTCAQGALATWGGPVRAAFDVPRHYKLICGVSIGYASPHPVNHYAPGRGTKEALTLARRTCKLAKIFAIADSLALMNCSQWRN